MMKAMINKQAPPRNAAPATQAVQLTTCIVPEGIQQQLTDLQSQVRYSSCLMLLQQSSWNYGDLPKLSTCPLLRFQ